MPVLSASTSLSLISGLRRNEADAWERFYRLYIPYIYDWCRFHFRLQDADAEDASANVLEAVFGGIAQFRNDRPTDKFRGWLWTITKNKVYDHARGLAPDARPVGGSDYLVWLQNLPEPEESPESTLSHEGSIARRALEFIQAEFKESNWRAFWRMSIDGQTSRDVGEELDMTGEAVRQANSRVRRRLRLFLADLVDFD